MTYSEILVCQSKPRGRFLQQGSSSKFVKKLSFAFYQVSQQKIGLLFSQISRKLGNEENQYESFAKSGEKRTINQKLRQETQIKPELIRKVVVVSENFRKRCYILPWQFPETQTEVFYRIESALGFLAKHADGAGREVFPYIRPVVLQTKISPFSVTQQTQ